MFLIEGYDLDALGLESVPRATLPEHVDDAFGAADWRLDGEERARLDNVSTLEGPKKYA